MDILNLFQILVHKDYADRKSSYVTKILNFTKNANEIHRFISDTEASGGGDSPECYELVLKKVRTELNWRDGETSYLINL